MSRDYPSNSRVFVGNCPCEKTSAQELEAIFAPYGRVLEVVLRSSFAFIQFDSEQSVQGAIEAEQGRLVGGLALGKSVGSLVVYCLKPAEFCYVM